jgi:hypothetical protein
MSDSCKSSFFGVRIEYLFMDNKNNELAKFGAHHASCIGCNRSNFSTYLGKAKATNQIAHPKSND